METARALTAGYPPFDTPKPVAEGLYVVDSLLPGTLGTVLPVRMTVVRLADGGLLLHSATRFSAGLRAELERLGPISHLVAPNTAHWMFVKGWQQAVPTAVTWAVPGLRHRRQVRRSLVRLDHDLGEQPPNAWGPGFALVPVPGGFGFREVALFHQPSRTLMLADLVLNLEAEKLPRAMRPLLRLLGVLAPDGMAPAYLRWVVKRRRRDAAAAARQMLALAPERVIFAHGRWFDHDGAERLRRSLRWLVSA